MPEFLCVCCVFIFIYTCMYADFSVFSKVDDLASQLVAKGVKGEEGESDEESGGSTMSPTKQAYLHSMYLRFITAFISCLISFIYCLLVCFVHVF